MQRWLCLALLLALLALAAAHASPTHDDAALLSADAEFEDLHVALLEADALPAVAAAAAGSNASAAAAPAATTPAPCNCRSGERGDACRSNCAYAAKLAAARAASQPVSLAELDSQSAPVSEQGNRMVYKANALIPYESAMSKLAEEVFYYAPPPMKWVWDGKPGAAYPFNQISEAKAACASVGARLASVAELQAAQRAGAQWCACGATSDGLWQYPMQVNAGPGCGGRAGVITGCSAGGAVCIGPKPQMGKVAHVAPFNPQRYYAVEPSWARVSPDGYTNEFISDWGYAYDRVWLDAKGDGLKRDYGRWVGVAPNIWFSVAIRDCPGQLTAKGEYAVDAQGRVSAGPEYRGFGCDYRPAHVGQKGRRVPTKPVVGDPKAGSASGYKNAAINDWGYGWDRVWVDALGTGVFDSYGRWVGNPGPANQGIWFSVALRDCPSTLTARGVFVWKNGKVYRGPHFASDACIQKLLAAQKKPQPGAATDDADFPYSKGDLIDSEPAMTQHKEVFYFSPGQMRFDYGGAPGALYPFNSHGDAIAACRSLGAELASPAQLLAAHRAGAQWCACGAVTGGGWSFPMQQKADGCGNMIGVWTQCKVGGATCYGVKPAAGAVAGVHPFGVNRYYEREPKLRHPRSDGFSNKAITDWGLPQRERLWLDAKGDGHLRDYGRWVGAAPNVFFSVAFRDCPDQYTGKDEFVLTPGGDVVAGPAYQGVYCASAPPRPGALGKELMAKEAAGEPQTSGSPTGGYKPTGVTDWGYAHSRYWIDVDGDGKLDSYGRFVGLPGGLWFSVAQKGCANQYSARDVYKLWRGKVYRGPKYDSDPCAKAREEERQRKADAEAAAKRAADAEAARRAAKKAGLPPKLVKEAARQAMAAAGDQVLNVGNTEVHIHVTQLSAPEPDARALGEVEERLDRLHDAAMAKVDSLLADLEAKRRDKKPCLQDLQQTVTSFRAQFLNEAQQLEKVTHKFSYADDAPTLI